MVPRFSIVSLLGLSVGQRFTRAQIALITKSHPMASTFLSITTSAKPPTPASTMAEIRRSDHGIKHQSTKKQSTNGQSIQTQRLYVHEARNSDLTDFHKLFSSCDIMQYWALAQSYLHRPNRVVPQRHDRIVYKRRYRIRHRASCSNVSRLFLFLFRCQQIQSHRPSRNLG